MIISFGEGSLSTILEICGFMITFGYLFYLAYLRKCAYQEWKEGESEDNEFE